MLSKLKDNGFDIVVIPQWELGYIIECRISFV